MNGSSYFKNNAKLAVNYLESDVSLKTTVL